MGMDEGREEKQIRKGSQKRYVCVPTTKRECKYYILQTYANKQQFQARKKSTSRNDNKST